MKVRDFIEKTFIGPIWKQVKDVLDYISTTIIEEKVVKIKNQAEAERYYNYPYNALEEAIVNAVFHKSYREAEPVEIRILSIVFRLLTTLVRQNGSTWKNLRLEKLGQENTAIAG